MSDYQDTGAYALLRGKIDSYIILRSAVTALYRSACGCCGDYGSTACIIAFIAEVVITVRKLIAGYAATTVKSVGVTGGQLRRRVQHVAVRFVWTDGKDHVSGAVCNGESGICGVGRSGAAAGTIIAAVSTGTAIVTRSTLACASGGGRGI